MSLFLQPKGVSPILTVCPCLGKNSFAMSNAWRCLNSQEPAKIYKGSGYLHFVLACSFFGLSAIR